MFDQYLLNKLSLEGGTGRVLKLLMGRIHIFDDSMKIRWRAVIGLPMRCTKMDQNGHHSRTELKCLESVLSDLYDLFLDWMDT